MNTHTHTHRVYFDSIQHPEQHHVCFNPSQNLSSPSSQITQACGRWAGHVTERVRGHADVSLESRSFWIIDSQVTHQSSVPDSLILYRTEVRIGSVVPNVTLAYQKPCCAYWRWIHWSSRLIWNCASFPFSSASSGILAWLRPPFAHPSFLWDSVWNRGPSLELQRQIFGRTSQRLVEVIKFNDVEVKRLFTVVQSWHWPVQEANQATKKPSLLKTTQYWIRGMLQSDGKQPWRPGKYRFFEMTTHRKE